MNNDMFNILCGEIETLENIKNDVMNNYETLMLEGITNKGKVVNGKKSNKKIFKMDNISSNGMTLMSDCLKNLEVVTAKKYILDSFINMFIEDYEIKLFSTKIYNDEFFKKTIIPCDYKEIDKNGKERCAIMVRGLKVPSKANMSYEEYKNLYSESLIYILKCCIGRNISSDKFYNELSKASYSIYMPDIRKKLIKR